MEFVSNVRNVSHESGFKWSINNFSTIARKSNFVIRSKKIYFAEIKSAWMLEVSPTRCNSVETCIKLKCIVFDNEGDENSRYKFRIKFGSDSLLETPYGYKNRDSDTVELHLQTMITNEAPFVLDVAVVYDSIAHDIEMTRPGRIETPFSSLLNMRDMTERESSTSNESDSDDENPPVNVFADVHNDSSQTNDSDVVVESEHYVGNTPKIWELSGTELKEVGVFRQSYGSDNVFEENAQVQEPSEEQTPAENLEEPKNDESCIVTTRDENSIQQKEVVEENDDTFEEEYVEANDEISLGHSENWNSQSTNEQNVTDDSDDDEDEAPGKLENSYVRLTKRIKKIYLVKMKQIAETTSRFLVSSARFKLEPLIHDGSRSLAAQMTTDNFVEIWSIAKELNIPYLKSLVVQFVINNRTNINYSNQLPSDLMLDVVRAIK